MRMVRDDRYKLIWYPTGNRIQLFDMEKDPNEMCDVANRPGYADAQAHLTELMVQNLHGRDLEWVSDGKLVGMPDKEYTPQPNRGLAGQRGWR